MPGLIRGVARTAAIAGTATAVSNRVSRRQAGRWASHEQREYEEHLAQQQYAQQYAEPPYEQYAPRPSTTPDRLTQLQRLGELRAQGVLTEAEFQQQKLRILNS